MPAQYTVGQTLPDGSKVTADTYQTFPDGSSVETMTSSIGDVTTTYTPGPGTKVANQQTINQRVQANLTTLETWISNNPSGAVLTGPQTLVLAKMLVGLCRLLLNQTSTTGGA